MVRTRSEMKRLKEFENENNISLDDDDQLLDDSELIEEIEEEEEQLEYQGTISNRSPYSKLRRKIDKELQEVNADDTIVEYSVKKRISKKRTSRSRSSSPAGNLLRKQQQQFVREKVEDTKSSNCSRLIWIVILFLISFISIGTYINLNPESTIKLSTLYNNFELSKMFSFFNKSKTTYLDIIKEYKSNLPGISSAIIETAIEKYEKGNTDMPVVLLLNGNESLIHEFYSKLAYTLIKTNDNKIDIDRTIIHVDDLEYYHGKAQNILENEKIVLFHGLRNLKAENYMQVFTFVDSDSFSKNCLIVISLEDDVNRTKVDFTDVESMESYVRNQLRSRWNTIDSNNLEAFLNRIISFVAYLF